MSATRGQRVDMAKLAKALATAHESKELPGLYAIALVRAQQQKGDYMAKHAHHVTQLNETFTRMHDGGELESFDRRHPLAHAQADAGRELARMRATLGSIEATIDRLERAEIGSRFDTDKTPPRPRAEPSAGNDDARNERYVSELRAGKIRDAAGRLRGDGGRGGGDDH